MMGLKMILNIKLTLKNNKTFFMFCLMFSLCCLRCISHVMENEGKKIISYTESDGLCGDTVHAIAFDSIGNTWFGTEGGLSKFNGKEWELYLAEFEGAYTHVRDIAVAANGDIWICAPLDKGVKKFDGTTWTSYMDNVLVSTKIKTILIDKNQYKWFGSDVFGISMFDNKQWHTFNKKNGFEIKGVHDMVVTDSNHILIASYEGIYKYDGSELMKFNPEEGPDRHVRSLAIDSLGNLWVGTIGDLYMYDGYIWKNFKVTQYLPESEHGYSLHHVAVNRDNYIFVNFTELVGDKGGVLKYNGTDWTTIDKSVGLIGNSILSIEFAPDGTMWVGTTEGVTHFLEY